MSGPGFIAGGIPPALPPARWPARADAPARRADAAPPWRDELRLVLTITGAMATVFLPAAWIVVGSLSATFVAFAAAVTVDWAVAVALEIALLRALRSGAFVSRPPLALQFLAIAAAGFAFKLLADSVVGPITERARLGSGEDWNFVVGIWTDVMVALYLVYEREGRSRHALAAHRLASVQRAQVRARRELVDVQLRAMQARVDPQFFFDTLDTIEALYCTDAARAEALFDELVVFLRTALPHVDSASSVLARELALAESCLRMETLATGRKCRLEADVATELIRSPFPAGVLLPLIQGTLTAARDRADIAIDVSAGVVAGAPGDASVRVLLSAPRPPSPATCERVRESLQALFGDTATLQVESAEPDRFQVIVSLPHDEP